MLTYKLVQPSFALFKLASILGAIPFQVSVSSGKLEPKNTKVVLWIHRVFALLKILQLLISLFNLSHSLEQSSRSIQNALVVLMMLCVVVVALVWNFESEKHHIDSIILLSPLRRLGKSGGQVNRSCDESIVRDGKRNVLRKKLIGQLLRTFVSVVSYLREYYKEFLRCLPSFSVHDMLTIIVPRAISSIIFFGYLGVVFGDPPEDALSLSILNAEMKGVLAMRAATMFFDMLVSVFVGLTCQLAFFGLCATHAIYRPVLKQLERFIDNNGIKSSQNMDYVWQEIRRLQTIVSLINHVSSNCLYPGKILAFSCSVFGSFYVLRFGITDLVSTTTALLAVQAILFYVLCIGNAYVITEEMDKILQKIKFGSQSHVGTICRRELQQRVKSVRSLTFTEGGFREMSRETTPNFVDFYVNQVIALVLTF